MASVHLHLVQVLANLRLLRTAYWGGQLRLSCRWFLGHSLVFWRVRLCVRCSFQGCVAT